MSLLRVREKNQVTLPREVMAFLQLQAPSHVEYTLMPDGVLIRPARLPASKAEKLSRLLALPVKNTAYEQGRAQDIDDFIDSLRQP